MRSIKCCVLFAIISAFMGGSAGGRIVTESGHVVRSKRTSDWLGNEKVEHLDKSGVKVAESRRQSDWLGEKTTHTTASGKVIGESRERTDWIGKKTDHYSATGEHVGESRVHTDWIGDKVDHYSKAGEHVGESRHQSDLLGGHVAHQGESPVDRRQPAAGRRLLASVHQASGSSEIRVRARARSMATLRAMRNSHARTLSGSTRLR